MPTADRPQQASRPIGAFADEPSYLVPPPIFGADAPVNTATMLRNGSRAGLDRCFGRSENSYGAVRMPLDISRLTRRAKHRQNGIIERSGSSPRDTAGFVCSGEA
jgi:hypothetical protein